jgi:hypothetical protein
MEFGPKVPRRTPDELEAIKEQLIEDGTACSKCGCDFAGVRWIKEELIAGVCATCRARKRGLNGDSNNKAKHYMAG